MRPFSLRSSSGFSLVELMVALVLSFIAMIAIYRSYVAIRVGVEKHEQDCEIHQNLRVGMQWMTRELRMAGYDPNYGAEAGFVVALDDEVRFTANYGYIADEEDRDVDDSDPTGWEDEDVTYALVATNLVRTDHNDNGGAGSTQIIISNVDALRFVYYDGSNPPELLEKPLSSGFDRDKIRDVDIILVVRATNEDYAYTNNRPYPSTVDEYDNSTLNSSSGSPDFITDEILEPQNDNFRRGRMVGRVKARNAGL